MRGRAEERRARRCRSAAPCPPSRRRRAAGAVPAPFSSSSVSVDERDDEERRHGREDRVALLVAADHPAEGARQRERDREHEHDLEEVRPGRRVLERMRGVRVEESAAVRAELLDRLLRGDRAAGQVLRVAGERRDLGEAVEVLHDAADDQHDRADDRERQQQPERCRGTGRPRSCRSCPTCGARSRAPGRSRRRCRRPPTRSSARRGRRAARCSPCVSSGEYDCQFVFVTNEAAVLNDSPSGTAGQPERVRQHRLRALQDVDEEHADEPRRRARRAGRPATTARSAGRRRRDGRGRARPSSPSSRCRGAPCSRRAGGRRARGSGRGWPPAGRRTATSIRTARA